MEKKNEELERIERGLLEEEPQDIDKLMKEFLEEPLPEVEETAPAFDDPDKLEFPDEPVVYCNYSNDYGRAPEEETATVESDEEKKMAKDEKAVVSLLTAIAIMAVGIVGVLVYWLIKSL